LLAKSAVHSSVALGKLGGPALPDENNALEVPVFDEPPASALAVDISFTSDQLVPFHASVFASAPGEARPP
jgi:hypothetical protein